MEFSYDDKRQLSILAAQEDTHAVEAALAGRQAAYDGVAANSDLSAVFGAFMDHGQRMVVLKDTAEEGTGCRVALTHFNEELALIKEVINPAAFKTELLLHDKANDRIKTALLCHSMRHQLMVTELGPRQDMLREIRRLVESDTPPPNIALFLVGRLHEVVHLLNVMAQSGSSHVDLKWENISRVKRGKERQRPDEEQLHMALIDLASSMVHGGRITAVDPDKVFTTVNHSPPELLWGELHPTNDMHAVGHMTQSLIVGLGTCTRLGLPTLHVDTALLAAFIGGVPLETAWTRRCGLRPNVVAILVLLQAVLVAPPSRQPSWDFMEEQTARLKCLVENLEAPGEEQAHILAALEMELQLLLQLSSATRGPSGAPVGPKACLPRSVLEAVRRRYAAVHKRYTDLQKLREFIRTDWKKELPAPTPSKVASGLPLIDANDEQAMDAHFARLPPPHALTSEEYCERKQEALSVTMDLLCPDDYDMTVFLRILDPAASEDSVLKRLSIAQQCADSWNGFDLKYFVGYAIPFLPTGSAASSAAASTRSSDALTLGMNMVSMHVTHGGGHALRAAVPCGLPAQQGAAQQRGGQQQRWQRGAAAAEEGQEDGGVEAADSDENASMNSSAGAMPPPPLRAAARRGATCRAAPRGPCVEAEAAEAASATGGSKQAQQVCKWMQQMEGVERLPIVAAASRNNNRPPEGTVLWQCGYWKGRPWTSSLSAGDMNRLVLLGRDWSSEFRQLRWLLAQFRGSEVLCDYSGTLYIIFAPLQLSDGMLPAALEADLVQAGLLVRRRGRLQLVTDPLAYTIVFRCTFSGKGSVVEEWTNAGLRKGLAHLGMRLAAGEDDEGCGPVASTDGQRYVLTPLGASLWYRIMRHMLGSEEAALRLPVYYATRKPADNGASGAWRQGATPLQLTAAWA